MDDKLKAALEHHRDASAEAASSIDVRAAVAEAIAEKPSAWRRLWLVAPVALAAAAFVLWFALRSSAVTVVASGALTVADKPIDPAGETISVPASVVASARGGGKLHSSSADIALWPGASLRAESGSRLSELEGGAQFAAREETEIHLAVGTIRGRGVFDVETRIEGQAMTLTKNHKIAGVVAVAVAVTAGWIAFRDNDGNETKITEPGRAAIDSTGKVTMLEPSGGKGTVASAPGADGVSTNAGAAAPVSGAFWDDTQKRIVFALAGEVVDAATGEAINAFDLIAEPIKAEGFGASSLVRRSFSGRSGGDFVLNNLGLGTWRVEVRADGYAPSSQTVELGDLYANPLLLFPLTLGAQVTGEVVDWKGRAVEGARVGRPACFGDKPKKGCALAVTDKEGKFLLPAVPEEQTFALRADHKRYGFVELKNLRQAEGSTRHVVLRLSGIVRITGHVTRGESASPVGGAVIGVESGEQTETSPTGSYELFAALGARQEAFVVSDPARPKAKARIVTHPESRSARELRWVEADTHVAEVEIDFQLQMESATILGKVTGPDGKAMAGIVLDFANTAGWKRGRKHETFPTTAITDDSGSYRLDDVPFGAGYSVSFKNKDGERIRLGFVTVVGEEEVTANFSIGSGTIRGEFVDESGERFAASSRGCARLGAVSSSGVHHLARCYPDGRFEFKRLPPGTYTLENRLPRQDSPIEITKTKVEVKAGEVAEGVQVPAKGEPSVQWRFRVLDGEGRFVPGAGIRYRQGNTQFTSNLQVGPDGIAKFALSKMYELVNIDAPGFQSADVPLEGRDPSEVIELRMERKAP